MRNLDALRFHLLDEGDRLVQMVEVLAVYHQVHREGNLVLADEMGEFDLVGVRFGSGDPVGGVFAGILEAELNVVETHIDQRLQSLV